MASYTLCMMSLSGWSSILVAIVMMTIAATVATRWLRAARLPGGAPGAAMVGGVMAGLLLGATVMGRIAPEFQARLFKGAAAERAALEELQREQDFEVIALMELGVTPIAIEERRADFEVQRAPARLAYEEALETHRNRWALALAPAMVAWLLLGSIGAARRSRSSERMGMALLPATGMVMAAGAPAFLLVRWLTDATVMEAAVFAIATGVGGAHLDAAARRMIPPDARRSVECATATALIAALVIWLIVAPGYANASILIGGCAALIILLFLRPRPRLRRLGRAISYCVLLPTLTALTIARCDFIDLADKGVFWIALVVGVLFSADGRWLGAWAGWRAVGALNPWRRAGAMLGAGAAGMQVMIAGLAAAVGALPPSFVAAAVVSATLLEVSGGVRGRFARALDADFADD